MVAMVVMMLLQVLALRVFKNLLSCTAKQRLVPTDRLILPPYINNKDLPTHTMASLTVTLYKDDSMIRRIGMFLTMHVCQLLCPSRPGNPSNAQGREKIKIKKKEGDDKGKLIVPANIYHIVFRVLRPTQRVGPKRLRKKKKTKSSLFDVQLNIRCPTLHSCTRAI